MRPMKIRAVFTAAAIAGALVVAPALAQTVPPPMISVSGEATISVAPDQAEIEAGVTSDAKTAREASEANNTAMGKLLLALKAANIDGKDIQTSRLSLQPQYKQNQPGQPVLGPPVIVGYRASNRVTIKLREISKVASVIDTLVAAGANDIGGIGFSVSNASKLLDEAREKAVVDARRKAEIYATATGVTLGAPLSISEEGGARQLLRGANVMYDMPKTSAPVSQGEATLQVVVSVSWAIKQAGQ